MKLFVICTIFLRNYDKNITEFLRAATFSERLLVQSYHFFRAAASSE